jgi:anti-sigma factor RsiW
MPALRHRRLRSKVESYFDGELDERASAQVHRHLHECWFCSGELETLRLVRAALRRRRNAAVSLPLMRLRRFARDVDPS